MQPVVEGRRAVIEALPKKRQRDRGSANQPQSSYHIRPGDTITQMPLRGHIRPISQAAQRCGLHNGVKFQCIRQGRPLRGVIQNARLAHKCDARLGAMPKLVEESIRAVLLQFQARRELNERCATFSERPDFPNKRGQFAVRIHQPLFVGDRLRQLHGELKRRGRGLGPTCVCGSPVRLVKR